MRPRQGKPSGTDDMFRSRLDQIMNMRHELVSLANRIDWAGIDAEIADAFKANGQPALPSRFMIGLLLLKQIYNLLGRSCVRALGRKPLFSILYR